ncbi:MAG: hypothetical protein KGY49_02490, partial [Wenzhouxiangellaceae bacterium]|nr:hypothetical protein [Wenzhouxiangellaceae bacterium]
ARSYPSAARASAEGAQSILLLAGPQVLPGCPAFKVRFRFASRFALAGDLLLSIAIKVGKSALTGGSDVGCGPELNGGLVSGRVFAMP